MDLRIRLQATLVWPGAYSLQPPADRCANGVLQGECAYHLLRPPKLPLGGAPIQTKAKRDPSGGSPRRATERASFCGALFVAV
jgi:hypothetical protein